MLPYGVSDNRPRYRMLYLTYTVRYSHKLESYTVRYSHKLESYTVCYMIKIGYAIPSIPYLI